MSAQAGPSPERFFHTMNAFQQSAALKAAVELGVFTAIAEGHATAAALAERCRIAVRGARILADYLVVLGFLTRSGEGYALAEDAALFLDRNSPAYVGAAVEFLASTHIHYHFDNLADRVRNGGAPLSGDNSLAPNHEMWIRFARGMAGLMTMPAQLLARHVLGLPGIGGRPLRILDVAAGHGMYGIAFLQQSPQAHVVGLDWENVLPVAVEHATKAQVAERYHTLAGSAFEVPLAPASYDVVLIPNFLHHFDEGTNIGLLKKLHAALKPGGVAATLEFAPDGDRREPPGAVAFALVMLATTPAGDAYSVPELTAQYEAAGFKNVSAAMLPIGMQRLILGSK